MLRCSINVIYQAPCQAFDMSGSSIPHRSAKVGIIIHILQIRKPRQTCCYTESKWQNWDLNLRSVGLHSPTLYLIMLVPMTFMHWKCNFFSFLQDCSNRKITTNRVKGNLHTYFAQFRMLRRGQLSLLLVGARCSGKQHVRRKENTDDLVPSPLHCYLAVCPQNHSIVALEGGLQLISESASHFTDGEIG